MVAATASSVRAIARAAPVSSSFNDGMTRIAPLPQVLHETGRALPLDRESGSGPMILLLRTGEQAVALRGRRGVPGLDARALDRERADGREIRRVVEHRHHGAAVTEGGEHVRLGRGHGRVGKGGPVRVGGEQRRPERRRRTAVRAQSDPGDAAARTG